MTASWHGQSGSAGHLHGVKCKVAAMCSKASCAGGRVHTRSLKGASGPCAGRRADVLAQVERGVQRVQHVQLAGGFMSGRYGDLLV